MSNPETTKIGDTVYTFEVNRRVYRKDETDRGIGGPIYREHWIPWIIVGEEKRSWIVTYTTGQYPHKVSKASFKTASEVDDDCWVKDYRYRITRAVENCRDASMLRAIADLIDFDVKEAS